MPNLLILSCSARKHVVTGKVTAWNLYDGVVFRMVKRLQREGRFPTDVYILILSARHGLIHTNSKTAYYDQRMTKDLAVQQSSRNIVLLRNIMKAANYHEVFILAGRTYLAALHPVETWLSNGVKLTIAEGGIGQKMQLLKRWLLYTDTPTL